MLWVNASNGESKPKFVPGGLLHSSRFAVALRRAQAHQSVTTPFLVLRAWGFSCHACLTARSALFVAIIAPTRSLHTSASCWVRSSHRTPATITLGPADGDHRSMYSTDVASCARLRIAEQSLTDGSYQADTFCTFVATLSPSPICRSRHRRNATHRQSSETSKPLRTATSPIP